MAESVSDGAALIEQPQGEPGAVMDTASGLRRVGGGFEGAGDVVSRAVAAVGSWEGQASMAFRGHATSYRTAAASCDRVLADAQMVLSRYADVLEEVRRRIRELRREEEDCLERIRQWKDRLADAERRAADAVERMLAAPLDFGVAGEGALAAQLQAQDDLAAARDDASMARARIAEERDELELLRDQARDARRRAEEAEQRAAGRITSLAAELPDVQFPGGPASPSAFAGTAFGPPVSPFAADSRWAAAMGRAAARDDEEEDNGGNFGDFLAGGINEFTFGTVDLGGDKDSDLYNAGRVASYVPWNPVSAVKSAGTGALKLGAKAVKSTADDAVEAGAKRGTAAGTARHADAVPYGPITREQHLAALRRQADEAGVEMPTGGMVVERTYGTIPDSRGVLGGSGPFGQSWTPASIADMKAPRDAMGLPEFNGGRFVIRARLHDVAAIGEIRTALPWTGPGGYFQRGGAPEYLIPNAADNLRVISVRGVNPDF
jgi:uncharacterized protein YukE